MTTSFEKLAEKRKEYQEALKKDGEDAVKETLNTFFTKNPKVAAVRWTQYTPGFNDGDPCIFEVNEVRVRVESEEFLDSYDVKNPTLKKEIDNLSTILSNASDVLEAAFGDHAEIVATRAKIVVGVYDAHE